MRVLNWLRRAALLLILGRGGDSIVATIYVTLIVRGYKTFCDVPQVLRTEVAAQLAVLELPELAVCNK